MAGQSEAKAHAKPTAPGARRPVGVGVRFRIALAGRALRIHVYVYV